MAELQVTRRFAPPPEAVFDAWVEPDKARRFLFATPTGKMVGCEIAARVGGRFEITDRRPEMGDTRHVGTYLEVDRPRRLVFTFAVPQYDPTETRVALDFRPDGDGCRLTLTHTGVLEEWVERTREGWTMILGALAEVIQP